MTTQPKTHYTITAAHRITGKSRTTIQKHLQKGKLSCTEDESGVKQIAAIELIRVYGDACDFSVEEQGTDVGKSDTSVSYTIRTEVNTLEQRVHQLEEERRRERQQLESQIDHLQDALKLAQQGHNRATLLLEDRSGGGDWQRAIAEVEARISQEQQSALQQARVNTLEEIKNRPWWHLLLKTTHKL